MPWIHLRHLPAPRCLHHRSDRGSLCSTPAATAQHPADRARAREPGSRLTPTAEARPCPCTEAILTRPSGRSFSAPQPAGSGDLPPARRLGQPAAPFLRRGTASYLSGLAVRKRLGRAAVRTHLRRPSRRLSDTVASWGEKKRRLRGLGTLRWQGRDYGGPSAPAPPRGRVSRGTACREGNCRPRGSRAAGAAGGPMSRRCPRRDCPDHTPPYFCSLFFLAFPSFRPFPQNTTFPPSVPLPFLLWGR